jgi:hypothetical protein
MALFLRSKSSLSSFTRFMSFSKTNSSRLWTIHFRRNSSSGRDQTEASLTGRAKFGLGAFAVFLVSYGYWNSTCVHKTLLECCLDHTIQQLQKEPNIVAFPIDEREQESLSFLRREFPVRQGERPLTKVGWPHYQLSQLPLESLSRMIEKETFSLRIFSDDVYVERSKFEQDTQALFCRNEAPKERSLEKYFRMILSVLPWSKARDAGRKHIGGTGLCCVPFRKLLC